MTPRYTFVKHTPGSGNTAGGPYATIAGGNFNSVNHDLATVGGGQNNTATNDVATVAGGQNNTASGYAATAGGGVGNIANATDATIAGGNNNVASGNNSTVAGGQTNTTSWTYATVGGGSGNTASGGSSTIGGGYGNTASGGSSTIGGGYNNTTSGNFATISGGQNNTALGDYSFAAGNRAKANHTGSFVWGDSTLISDVASTGANQFIVRASGGVWFGTNSTPTFTGFLNTSTGAYLSNGGTWTNSSDRNKKANFVAVNPQTVLQSVVNLPISSWNYTTQDASIRHIGPMAQDFSAAFAVGEDNTHISTIDLEGVALAAIQGLYQVVQNQKTQLQLKDQQITDLHTQLDDMNTRLTALENRAGSSQPQTQSSLPAIALFGGLVLGGVWLNHRKTQKSSSI